MQGYTVRRHACALLWKCNTVQLLWVREITQVRETVKRSSLAFKTHTADVRVDEYTQTHGEHNVFVFSNHHREDHTLSEDVRVVKDYRRIASETFKEWWSPQTLESATMFERKHLRQHWQQRAKVILSPTTLNPQKLLMVRTKRQNSLAMKGQCCPSPSSQKAFSTTTLCGHSRINMIELWYTHFIINNHSFCKHYHRLSQIQHIIEWMRIILTAWNTN